MGGGKPEALILVGAPCVMEAVTMAKKKCPLPPNGILSIKTEEKAKNLIHSVIMDHYIGNRSLRFSNCYYYHYNFGNLGALKLTRTAIKGLRKNEIKVV